MIKTYCIILAGGSGTRIKTNIPKQYLTFNGMTILEHTISKFNSHEKIDNIIVVTSFGNHDELIRSNLMNKFDKVRKIVKGGATRRESTFNGLDTIDYENAKVLIHDAVRPFVSKETINRCLEALDHNKAVYPAIPSADTIIKSNGFDIVDDVPIRKYMMIGQTPQGFQLDVIKEAHERALSDKDVDYHITNDCGLIKRYELADIKIVDGNRENVKLTYPEDLNLYKHFFEKIEVM